MSSQMLIYNNQVEAKWKKRDLVTPLLLKFIWKRNIANTNLSDFKTDVHTNISSTH